MNNQNTDLQAKRRIVATSIASPFASLISKYATYPIQTIKTKIQAQSHSLQSVKSYKFGHSLDLVKQTWNNEGIRGFFRGVSFAAFGSLIAYSFYMTAYEKSKYLLGSYSIFQKYPSFNHFLSGINAEIVSCVLWLPIDIVKERMQVQSIVKIYHYHGPIDAIKKIKYSQGLLGLYRAFGATLIVFGSISAIFFMTYQKLKQKFAKNPLKPELKQSMFCSATAGAVSGFLTSPLSIAKIRMQIQRADKAAKNIPLDQTLYGYKNIFDGIYKCFKNQGFLGLYKGAGIRIMFTIPMHTISMSLTQEFRKQILKRQIDDYFK